MLISLLIMSFSINTVYYMAPFATMILAVPAMLLEGNGVLEWLHTHPSLASSLVIIFSSGVLAFCLNFSIFYVIHSTTAVTFNVAGNLKVKVLIRIVFLRVESCMTLFWLSLASVYYEKIIANFKSSVPLSCCCILMEQICLSSHGWYILITHIYHVQVAVAVLVSWMIFRNPISSLNAVGCAVTLVGCTFYGYVRHLLSQQPPGTPRTPRTPRNRMELLPLVNDKLDDKV